MAAEKSNAKEAKSEPVQEETKKSNAKEVKPEPVQEEMVYTMEEFAENAIALFHTRKECVIAAFQDKKVSECTKSKAIEIMDEFKKREVK